MLVLNYGAKVVRLDLSINSVVIYSVSGFEMNEYDVTFDIDSR